MTNEEHFERARLARENSELRKECKRLQFHAQTEMEFRQRMVYEDFVDAMQMMEDTWSYHSATKGGKYHPVFCIALDYKHVDLLCPEKIIPFNRQHRGQRFRSACLALWSHVEVYWSRMTFQQCMDYIERRDIREERYTLTPESHQLLKCKVCQSSWAIQEDSEGDWYCEDCYVTFHNEYGEKVNPNI